MNYCLYKGTYVLLVSFLTTYFVLPKLSHIASRIGLMDQPNERKDHGAPRALVGGIGMVMGVSLAVLLAVPLSNLRGFMTGLIILVFVGFLDDYRELHHRMKFLAQIVAALLLIYPSNVVLHTFGNLLGMGPINFGHFSGLVTVFCAVGVINALNMIDGLDGLAGGVSLIALIAFAVMAGINGQVEIVLLSLSFGGAVIAFLRYNTYPASMFMGDAGSIALGFALAFFSIAITQVAHTRVPPVAPLLVLAVPITDTLLLMANRVLRKESPFQADRYHLHHILLRLGYSPQGAVRIIVGLTMAFSTLAVLGTVFQAPEYLLFFIFACYFLIGLFVSMRMKRVYQFLRKRKLPSVNSLG